jgi:hypothetical protein
MTKFILLFSPLFIIVSCSEEKTSNEVIETEKPTVASSLKSEATDYQVKTIYSDEQGWGYQILKDGKTLINQPNIPAVQGNKGFSSKENADKTGQFVLSKIYKGQFPPMVTTEELDSLDVI